VDSQFIFERNDAQETAFKLLNRGPEAVPVMLLPLNSQRMFQDPDAPFLPDIGSFSQHLIFKIPRELVVQHGLPEKSAY
jgi:hypothetical protein